MTSHPLPLKIAIATYGHTAAVKDGRVKLAGIAPEFIEVNPIIQAFRRMVRDVEFDVCEMAPATYMIAREAGSPFKALPVFIMRRFHHGGFVVREDAGITKPKDLEGKRAGVRAYSVSTGIWTRGILENDYGVDLSKVQWTVDDEEHVKTLVLPPNVNQAPAGKSLVGMMAAGDLQAAFTGPAGLGRAGAPKAGWEAPQVTPTAAYHELFPDVAAEEVAWFKRTGIYPTHGLIVVKDELLAKHPWVARSLYDAFVQAKRIWWDALRAGRVESDADRNYVALAKIVGDPLPYGIRPNLPAIEALIKYCYQQKLLRKHYAVSEMFVDPES